MNPVFLSLLFFLAFHGLMVKVIVEYNGFDLFGAISSKASKDGKLLTALAYQKKKIDSVPFTFAKYLLGHQESGKSETFLQKIEHNFYPVSVYQIMENVAIREKVIPKFEVSVIIQHDFTAMTNRLEKFTEVSVRQNQANIYREINKILAPKIYLSSKNEICNFPVKPDIIEKQPSENVKREFQAAFVKSEAVKLLKVTHSLETMKAKEQILLEKKHYIVVAKVNAPEEKDIPKVTKEICSYYNSSLDVDKNKFLNRTNNEIPMDSENEHTFYVILNKIILTQPSEVAEITFTLFITVIVYIILFTFEVLGVICLSLPTILELLNLKALMSLPSFNLRDDSDISMIAAICTFLISSSYWLFIRPYCAAPNWQYLAMVRRRRAQIQHQKEERLRLEKNAL